MLWETKEEHFKNKINLLCKVRVLTFKMKVWWTKAVSKKKEKNKDVNKKS